MKLTRNSQYVNLMGTQMYKGIQCESARIYIQGQRRGTKLSLRILITLNARISKCNVSV